MCSCDIWTMENVTHGKMNSRVRESFLSLEGNQKNPMSKVRGKEKGKGKKKKKRKKGKKMRKNKREEDPCVERKEKNAMIPDVPTIESR